jgi:hypothetical protein
MEHGSIEPGTIAQWVGAFATFAAVLVALFKRKSFVIGGDPN